MFKYIESPEQLIPEDSAFSVKLRAIWDAYGLKNGLCELWGDENGSYALRFDGAVSLSVAEKTDLTELKCLLGAVGYSSVFGEYETVKKLFGEDVRHGAAMKYKGELLSERSEDGFDSLEDIYSLISENIPDSFTKDGYLFWLSDVTYRQRRNACRVRCIKREEKAVACCMTSAETENAAVISGVACDKAYRGTGLGGKCVRGLIGELQKENKEIYVFVLNEKAKGFYKHLGFTECGQWAQV